MICNSALNIIYTARCVELSQHTGRSGIIERVKYEVYEYNNEQKRNLI